MSNPTAAFVVLLLSSLQPAAFGFLPAPLVSQGFPSVSGSRCRTDIMASTLTRSDDFSVDNPMKVLIAGAGVGGLSLGCALKKQPGVEVTVLEKTSEFKRFGGPIQLASNALQILKEMDADVYGKVQAKFTNTGDKTNGIKDGVRDEWYAKFDLGTPAVDRNMPYTGVIDRPDLQEILLEKLQGNVKNGAGVESYERHDGGVKVKMDDGTVIDGDVLIGADGIWSNVRASMREEPARGDGSGVTYSGYTVFAGELAYDNPTNGEVGYAVYIGPGQYFVITDIGKGNYQWYAFLAREPGSAASEEKPDGNVKYLSDIFEGWSADVHAILTATQEHEIEQRDLYDRPPSVVKPWIDGPVALLGDSVHAMMPNLGQGGCQAIEDAMVLGEELANVKHRNNIQGALDSYRSRRLVRSAAVQGLSRFASDIIIRGFDTPFKYVDGRFENFNYAGVVTRMLQPILPIFFSVQFNFLYDGYKNKYGLDLKNGAALFAIGSVLLILAAGSVGEVGILGSLGLEGLLGGEGMEA
eukprot:CAMPEP_0182499818 /NCGR_PEP_ID=MMETSP1321-20130603/7968_1 /TAXON_ID=91990 /ORGANISM="Bolidomonas sp., Strain RCC1657" /LENGTH=524 /DNA_ID=CAMNT_0024704067 /DNA_START=50 /DNA_END=1621 /DNA_ORIENTATION=-